MGESSDLWVKVPGCFSRSFEISQASYLCNSKNPPPKKKRWNDCPRKKNTDVLQNLTKGNSHRPELYRRVQLYMEVPFWTCWRFRGFCLANITSQSNISNQPVCCMKQNSRFLANNPPPKRFVLTGDRTKIYHRKEEYHSEVSGISKWVCLVWSKPSVIFPQQVTRHQNKPNTYPACPTILTPWKSPVFKTAQCCFIRLCHLCKSFQHR